MDDEIKEILEMLRKYGSTNDKVLLDYITNLQQNYNDNVSKYEELLEKYFNLQYRIDKAISILNKRKEDVEDFSWVEMRRNSYYEECDEIINILQGDSNE